MFSLGGRNLIQKHKTIAWPSVKFDVTHVLFVLDCFKPTVGTMGSQFLFRHRVRCPLTPQCLKRGTISNFLKMIFFSLFHILDLKDICFLVKQHFKRKIQDLRAIFKKMTPNCPKNEVFFFKCPKKLLCTF